MRLPVFDPQARFSCHHCGDCCTRPWRVVIEDERVEAIKRFDWGAKYPKLAGRTLLTRDDASGANQHVLAKDDGGACIFYNHEKKNCTLHAELGADAKPLTCRRYPFGVTAAPDGDFVFAHFACPSVQANRGERVADQSAELATVLRPTRVWTREDVPLTAQQSISIEASRLLAERCTALFEPSTTGDLWEQFARAIRLVVAVGQTDAGELHSALLRPDFGEDLPQIELSGFASLRQAPLTSRTLLGINLWTDLFPADSVGRTVSFRQRLSMVARLTQLAQMRGAYASRLLERNIPLGRIGAAELAGPVPAAAEDVLRRWFRSRFHSRSFAGQDLSICGGLHSLILDFNAVLFFARALAVDTSAPPTDEMFTRALSVTEAQIASQRRLFHAIFPAWTVTSLESPSAAWSSLRLFHPAPPPDTASTAGDRADGLASCGAASGGDANDG